MPANDSKQDLSFFFHGMKIKVSDYLPERMFAIEPPKGPPVFYAFDPASPEGDRTSVVRFNPRFRCDIGLLDDLSEDDLKIAKSLDIEMRAMRAAVHLEQTRQMITGGATTAVEPWQTPAFRYEDMRRIMEEMYAAEHARKVEQIKTLMAAGFIVTVSDATRNTVVVLPEDYREAMKEAKEPQRPFWPGEWPKELLDELRRPGNVEEWRNQYMGSFDVPEDKELI